MRGSRRLFARFVLRMLVAFLLVGVVLHLTLTAVVRHQQLQYAESYARFTTEHVIAPKVTSGDLRRPMLPERYAHLRRVFQEELRTGDVTDVTVWRPDGTVVFSEDSTLIGRRFVGVEAKLARVLTRGSETRIGGPPAVAAADPAPDTSGGGSALAPEVQTLVAVPATATTPAFVAEVSQDYGPMHAVAVAALWRLDATLGLGLLLLFALVVPLVRRAGRQLHAQAGELAVHLERERATVERLTELDRTKSHILTAVSHELRTPLTVVRGVADLLHRHGDDLSHEHRERLVDGLNEHALRLDRMLGDLLDVDRLSRGTVAAQRRPTNLRVLVRRVVREAGVSGHEVHVTVPDDLEVPVDAGQVERILENLLRNADRHTPEDTPIWVRAEVGSEATLLVVEDAGPGIAADDRTRIFEPFVHGPDVPSYSPGTGIGLALVARLAELHGGRAWVEERPGGGASFRVLLAHAG